MIQRRQSKDAFKTLCLTSILVVDTETSLAEEKKDERSRLTALVREIERFLSDGLVKVRYWGQVVLDFFIVQLIILGTIGDRHFGRSGNSQKYQKVFHNHHQVEDQAFVS